jgi:hypothetical protein
MENTNPKNFSSRYEEEMDATRSGFSLEVGNPISYGKTTHTEIPPILR